MKRHKITAAVAAGILVLAIIGAITSTRSSPGGGPAYATSETQPKGPFRTMHYEWSSPLATHGNRVWFYVTPVGTTNQHLRFFRYDLKAHQVLGEMTNGFPMIENADGSKLLCLGVGNKSAKWKAALRKWLNGFSMGRWLANFIPDSEEFWVLDLKANTAKRLGSFTGMAITLTPSPGMELGFCQARGSWRNTVYIYDLEKPRLYAVKIRGEPRAWLNEQEIVFNDPSPDLRVFNIKTGKTRELFSATELDSELARLKVSARATDCALLTHWNGHGHDLLFAEAKQKNWGHGFLARFNPANRQLTLLYNDFKFQWGGRFDPEMKNYVYEGESGAPGAGGNGGVWLRDLTRNTDLVIVTPDNGGQYALANFYQDGIVYWHKRHLFTVDINGSNSIPFLPDQ